MSGPSPSQPFRMKTSTPNGLPIASSMTEPATMLTVATPVLGMSSSGSTPNSEKPAPMIQPVKSGPSDDSSARRTPPQYPLNTPPIPMMRAMVTRSRVVQGRKPSRARPDGSGADALDAASDATDASLGRHSADRL